MMRRLITLLYKQTVLHFKSAFGLFFIVWSLIVNVMFSQASIITEYGLTNGDQSSADQLFHQGMESYISSDFINAYKAWSKAVESQHAKASFNIARMWLQGKVPGEAADEKKAIFFFKQAVSLGYQPAEKYLKQPEKRLSNQQDAAYLQETNLDKDIQKQTEDNERLQSTSILANNAWLKKYPNNAWVIQIFASQESALLKQMIRDYSLKDKAHILTEKIDGDLWYKLIYGQYASKQQALSARQLLPERLRKEKPWVRSVGAMKKG